MTRIAIITPHTGESHVVRHGDAATDEEILGHVKGMGNLHRIKTVQICEVITEYSNVTPIENWLKITKKLTS